MEKVLLLTFQVIKISRIRFGVGGCWFAFQYSPASLAVSSDALMEVKGAQVIGTCQEAEAVAGIANASSSVLPSAPGKRNRNN